MKLDKDTKEFILSLLLRELEAEYIQDNARPLEVEYIRELINASIKYGKQMGFPYDYMINEKIEQLLNKEES